MYGMSMPKNLFERLSHNGNPGFTAPMYTENTAVLAEIASPLDSTGNLK